MKLAAAYVWLCLGCGKPSEPAPQPTPTPAPSRPVPRPPTVDLDLDVTKAGSLELVLETGAASRTIAFPAAAKLDILVTHLRGDLARISVDVFEPGAVFPFESNSITCAEPGCSVKTTHVIGPNTRWLTVKVAAEGSMTVQLSATRM